MSNFIRFPKKTNQRYYDIHYQYVRDIFDITHHQIVEQEGLDVSPTAFRCYYQDKEIIFDFSDSGNDIIGNSPVPVFKFHYRAEHNSLEKIYPFAPVSFYFKQWFNLKTMRKEIQYNTKGTKIMNNQRAYGNAVMRRNIVKNIIMQNYMGEYDYNITDQQIYFNKINDMLVHVFVPGQNENMIDRAQLQFFGLGACTISTELPEILPYGEKLVPFKHYLMMQNDFSDLVGAVSFVKEHRADCVKMGKEARKLFDKCCTPDALIKWIQRCI